MMIVVDDMFMIVSVWKFCNDFVFMSCMYFSSISIKYFLIMCFVLVSENMC